MEDPRILDKERWIERDFETLRRRGLERWRLRGSAATSEAELLQGLIRSLPTSRTVERKGRLVNGTMAQQPQRLAEREGLLRSSPVGQQTLRNVALSPVLQVDNVARSGRAHRDTGGAARGFSAARFENPLAGGGGRRCRRGGEPSRPGVRPRGRNEKVGEPQGLKTIPRRSGDSA